jgi:hypothetical protein
MSNQYIPPASDPVPQYIDAEIPLVQLPNTRVHWLDPHFTHTKTRGDRLMNFMGEYVTIFAKSNYDTDYTNGTILYIIRTIINHLLEIGPDDGIPWVLHEPNDIESFNNDPSKLQTERDSFVQSSESSKILFFKKVYDKLIDSKYFKKCYSGDRFIEWKILQETFIEFWNGFSVNNIEFFYFCVQRVLMDFFTCCRILKEEGRWYKNIVIYAGYAHTSNIERMLLSLDFQNIPLPSIPYNPTCSTRKKRKKRKTRRHKDVKP